MHTSAANSNALSRNGISAQLMNTKYSPCISECKTKLKQNTVSTTIANQKGVKQRAPTKDQFITHELVSQIPCFGIMKESLLLM